MWGTILGALPSYSEAREPREAGAEFDFAEEIRKRLGVGKDAAEIEAACGLGAWESKLPIVDLTALPRKRREPEADRLVLSDRGGSILWIRTS